MFILAQATRLQLESFSVSYRRVREAFRRKRHPSLRRGGAFAGGAMASAGGATRGSDTSVSEWRPPSPPDKVHVVSSSELEAKIADGQLAFDPSPYSTKESLSGLALELVQRTLREESIESLRLQLYFRERHPESVALAAACRDAGRVMDIATRHWKVRGKVIGLQGQVKVKEVALATAESRSGDQPDFALALSSAEKKLNGCRIYLGKAEAEQQELETGKSRDVYEAWDRSRQLLHARQEEDGTLDLQRRLEHQKDLSKQSAQVGQNFEQICGSLLSTWLCPDATSPRHTNSTAIDAKASVGMFLLLANVCFPNLHVPINATAEFDYVLVKITGVHETKESAEGPGVIFAAAYEPLDSGDKCLSRTPLPRGGQVLDVEVLTVVECKNSPKAILSDIATMDRGLRFFSGLQIPGDHPTFTSALLPVRDGPVLRFTAASFAGFADKAQRLRRLVYVAWEGPLGPSSNMNSLVVQRLMDEGSIFDWGASVHVSDAFHKGILKAAEDEASRVEKAIKLLSGLAIAGNLWLLRD